MTSTADHSSEEGVTIRLIGELICISHIIAQRDLESNTVQNALADLHSDECVDIVFKQTISFLDSIIGDQKQKLSSLYSALQEKDAIIEQRNNMLSEMHSELELTKAHLKACREKIWKVKGVVDE